MNIQTISVKTIDIAFIY